MRKAWTLIVLSALCDLAGAILSQILASNSLVNPLVHLGWWSPALGGLVRNYGLVLGGTCRFGLLAGGLARAFVVYWKALSIGVFLISLGDICIWATA